MVHHTFIILTGVGHLVFKSLLPPVQAGKLGHRVPSGKDAFTPGLLQHPIFTDQWGRLCSEISPRQVSVMLEFIVAF